MNNFIITEHVDSIFVKDKKGKKINVGHRSYSCFIITLTGKIKFSFKNGFLIADSLHPVFLPQGLSYTNECLETAESYVFYFSTLKPMDSPMQLSSVPTDFIDECFKSIRQASFSTTKVNQMQIFEILYSLARRLFATENDDSASVERILTQAVEYMMKNYHKSNLTVKKIANHCYISEIYLRKLFNKNYHNTPFKMLTDIRMKKALLLLKEKRPIKEIALSVGYSDVFQFSRAFKRYYGKSPTK